MSLVRPTAFFPRQIPAPPASTLANWLWPMALTVLTASLGAWVVGDFSHPLSDGNDTDQFEYVGYFFAKNLTLWPFPHLDLINRQTFYPYGTNQVFLDWGFERDYWYALCSGWRGGAGPYLQYYYIYSLVVESVGTFLLLRSRFGISKAVVAGLIVSIFNVYALYKFPVHLNISVVHWTTLCLVATYRLLVDVASRKAVSLTYGLFWAWLHVQVLGQELGYVAGFALAFTTLTLPVLGFLFYREFRANKLIPVDWRFGPKTWLMVGLAGLSAWLYLPLTVQVAFTAWQFDFGTVSELSAWSHPARLLIPHLPGLHPGTGNYTQWLHDTFESYGQGSPGLYLVLLAGVGWWQTRRRVALWLPIVLMLGLCLLYHPVLLPTLKVFPWFSFNRHGGRASVVYPVLLCLLALPIQVPRSWPHRLLSGLLGMLMLVEWQTSFSQRLFIPLPVASDELLRYCAVVKKQPGVAVLDWPFCTIGADGVGASEGLCPYYRQQNAVFTFRRFYDKNGVGQYFGRLHPDQIRPFLRDGWPRLLTPDRSFTPADWSFFDAFLHRNNFAGINLYPDLLTPEQVTEFHRRYGEPIAKTQFPMAGKVEFIRLKPRKAK